MKTKIQNAKIFSGTGEVYKNTDILFNETGILEIGKNLGEADVTVDGTGKSVLPGFIDCHTHPASLTTED